MSSDDEKMAEFRDLLEAFQKARERDDVPAAESVALQCLSLAAEQQVSHPSESVQLMHEATEHENHARWEEAETTRQRVMASTESEGNMFMNAKAHTDLCSLYTLLGRKDQALAAAKQAVEAARKADADSLLVITLVDLSRCYRAKGELEPATAAAEEALQRAPSGKMPTVARARGLLSRAWCRVERREFAEAQEDLDVAWELLAPQAEAHMFAGVQSSIANWWEVSARLGTARDDLFGAVEALSNAVEIRRRVAQLPQLEGPYKEYWLAKTLSEYSLALSATGRTEEATEALAESRTIQNKIMRGFA